MIDGSGGSKRKEGSKLCTVSAHSQFPRSFAILFPQDPPLLIRAVITMRRFGINTVGDDTSSDANWKPSSDADDSSPSLPVRGGPPQRSVLTRSTSRRGSTSSEEGSGTSNIKFEQGRGSSSKLVQLPDDLPEDCIRPTKENTFSNPYQREMLEILESGGGIFALVRHLVDLERQKPPTPKPSSSTLLHSDPVEAFNLFACMSRPKLHSILSNTYVPDTIMQKWHVDSVIHQPQERADKLDPGQCKSHQHLTANARRTANDLQT